jgi:hypothetical protein
MKETYRVPRPPEIAGNENLVNSKDSEELLSVLGFCAPDASAAQEPRQAENRELLVIKTPDTASDDEDHSCWRDNSCHTGREEVSLAVNAE